ncbi:MAG: glycosyltransferase family 1 protein [Chloroflexi bacterium]|nr:glycosyltransferase family 1 protein [Chloroflexota bacterium]
MRRIALDYTPAFEQTGGIGRYTRELTAALAAIDSSSSFRLFVAGAAKTQLPQPPAENFTWKPTRISAKWLARLWHRMGLRFPVEAFVGPVDLFHATDFVLPPTRTETRTLLTVHDLSFIRVPSTASPALKAYLDETVPRSVEAADHVLADSAATKSDLIDLYGTRADKITVLYSGVDSAFSQVSDPKELERMRVKYGLQQVSYLLSVGTLQPRKNYSRVIEALSEVRQMGQDLHYVVAGGSGWLEDEMRQTIERTEMNDCVHLLGLVEDRDLPALYSGARLLAMVSLYEGFGLPALEAMACGTPVVTSNLSSLPEVGGEAALLVDPYDTGAIRDAIVKLETDADRRAQLIQAGFLQVKRFSWMRAARQLRSIYDEMLSMRR